MEYEDIHKLNNAIVSVCIRINKDSVIKASGFNFESIDTGSYIKCIQKLSGLVCDALNINSENVSVNETQIVVSPPFNISPSHFVFRATCILTFTQNELNLIKLKPNKHSELLSFLSQDYNDDEFFLYLGKGINETVVYDL